jgi:glycosyltransferase involved in cell wall biosynthesis
MYITTLAKEFMRKGVDVQVISLMCTGIRTDALKEKGVPVHCLGMRNPYDLSVLLPVITVLRNTAPHVVHTNHPIDAMFGNLAARLLGVPCLTTFHGKLDHYYLEKRSPLARYFKCVRLLWAERFAGALANRAIAVSQAVKQDLTKHHICRASKVTVIHHGVDLEDFDPARFSTHTSDLLTVGCISRISPEKGIHYFLSAGAKISESLSNVRFELIGEAQGPVEQGFLEENLRILEKQKKRNLFRILGYRADIPLLLSQMDVVVIPSLSEGFGMVAIEAMAMGKPVVASAVGGISEIVEHGETGLLVEPANANALSKAILDLLHNPQLREKLGNNARRRVEKSFSFGRMIEQTLACYDTVLNTN